MNKIDKTACVFGAIVWGVVVFLCAITPLWKWAAFIAALIAIAMFCLFIKLFIEKE